MFVSFSITLTLPNETFLICEDVQAFSVWEKDAKDASGFVGYCYLDLFLRGMYFFPYLLCRFDPKPNRGEIFACCLLASLGWLWSSEQCTPLSVNCDGCQCGETHSGETCSDETRRCRDVLPWDGPCFPWTVEQNQVFAIPWNKVDFILFVLSFLNASLRFSLVLRAISLKHLRRCWRIGMVFSSCLLITIVFLFCSFFRCWEPKVLQKMSSHYQTKEPLSEELIQKIINRWLLSENSGRSIDFWSSFFKPLRQHRSFLS